MGKLHGLPMGCDCCHTNHADTDQNSNENLMILLATAGVNFHHLPADGRRYHVELPDQFLP